jgi:glucosamine--fructose-6-phosphate aminotransferase (isomerizing)
LDSVVGAYAIVVLDRKDAGCDGGRPQELALGDRHRGEGEYFCASDATPIVEHTKNVVYLEDGEIAVIDRHKGLKIRNDQEPGEDPLHPRAGDALGDPGEGGYDHFMLKEIHEQSRSIRDCMRGRLNLAKGEVVLGGIKDYEQKFINAKRILIVGCGTSWHAGMVGEYLFEEFARIPVEVEYASEFRYRNPIVNEDDIVIAISQSGETADTLAAIELAKGRGATIIGICNVVGSSIARVTHAGSYTHAGPEIGVASTKAFTAQVTVLTLMALMIGQKKGMHQRQQLLPLAERVGRHPGQGGEGVGEGGTDQVHRRHLQGCEQRALPRPGYTFPVALEGALKLKEISYIHAEGYPAAEMKHGPIALIDEEMPVFVIATKGASYEKVVSNIQEVKARKGKIIAIVTEGDTVVKGSGRPCDRDPRDPRCLGTLVERGPLQLISYHIAVMRGCNVDQPSNLAKSVTVE